MCRFSVIMLSITLAETRLLTNRPVVAKTRRTLEGRPTIVDRWSANPKLARNRLMGEVALRSRLGSSAIPSTITHKSLVVRLPLLPESPGCRLAGAASRAWQAPVRTRRCWRSISPNRRTQWPQSRARDSCPRRRQALVARTRTFCVNLNNGSPVPLSDRFRSEIESAAGC